MTTATISQLKINPSFVIAQAADYPVAIANHSKVTGYFVGKELFESMIRKLEDQSDAEVIREADVTKGKLLEDIVKDLGL